jgi:hypothetical protein
MTKCDKNQFKENDFLLLADASESLVSLQSDFWDWRMRNNPTSSTYDGMYKYNDLMEEYSLEEFQTKRVR